MSILTDPSPIHSVDAHFMRRCLELAQLGQGKVSPNPMVGCIILDAEGQLVGEGYHQGYGLPHAEPMALAQAGARAQGGTLYVNLEPCNHHGQTPPCTEPILQAGIQRVVFGISDPNPKVSGGGADILLQKGLEVESGILKQDCEHLNEAFLYAVTQKRPFVVLKQALTLDGKVATRSGESQWITGPIARRWGHQLRAQGDAILSSAHSVLCDNSQLTVRDAPLLGKHPVRIILDRNAKMDPQALALFNTDPSTHPIWIITKPHRNAPVNLQKMAEWGAHIIEVPETGLGLSLPHILDALGEKRITQLLVESGGTLSGQLLSQGLVNKAWLIYNGKLILDSEAQSGFEGPPCFTLSQAKNFRISESISLGEDHAMVIYPNN